MRKSAIDQWYLNRYGLEPLLTPAEELILSKRIHEAAALRKVPADQLTPQQRHQLRIGERARKRMIRANQRLAVNVAMKYLSRCRSLELCDLVQEALIGLDTAVEKFDYAKGYKFSTYAYWWIRQAITRAIASKDTLIRVPQHAHDDLARVRRAIQKHASVRVTLSIQQAAELAGVDIKTLDLAIRVEGVASLNRFAHSDSDTELIDLMPDLSNDSEMEGLPLCADEVRRHVKQWLSEDHAQVISERFGLDDGEPKTLAAIAAKRGLSRERIRQVEGKALRRLRYCMSNSDSQS